MSTQSNPPAFPHARNDGMTLRDYFAAKAISGVFSNTVIMNVASTKKEMANFLARFAYEMADAMLAERERKP